MLYCSKQLNLIDVHIYTEKNKKLIPMYCLNRKLISQVNLFTLSREEKRTFNEDLNTEFMQQRLCPERHSKTVQNSVVILFRFFTP